MLSDKIFRALGNVVTRIVRALVICRIEVNLAVHLDAQLGESSLPRSVNDDLLVGLGRRAHRQVHATVVNGDKHRVPLQVGGVQNEVQSVRQQSSSRSIAVKRVAPARRNDK